MPESVRNSPGNKTPPKNHSPDSEAQAEFERAAEELLRGCPDEDREVHAAIIRGILALFNSPAAEAVREFYGNLTEDEQRLRFPAVQEGYRESLAVLIETAPDDALLQVALAAMGLDSSDVSDLTPEDLEPIVGHASREKLAATIRAHPMGGDPSLAASGETGYDLKQTDLVRLRRTLRFGVPRLHQAIEAAEKSDLEPLGRASVELWLAAAPLMLRNPPKSEKYGVKNRSELLLPNDRKPCLYQACSETIRNRDKYCPFHKRQVRAERDLEKKKSARPMKRLKKAKRIAENQMIPRDERMGLAGTLPEEFAPQTVRRNRRA